MGQSLHRAVAERSLAEAPSAVVLACCGGEIAPGFAPTSSNPACSSEYRSTRIQSMIEKKVKYERAADAEIEASMDTWSEVRMRKVESDEQSCAVANKAFFRSLQEEYVGGSWGSFFEDCSDGRIELREKIAEGAQGAIHMTSNDENVVKVFKREGWSLEELHKTWSTGMLKFLKVQSESFFSQRGVAPIGRGILLKDGSFGFLMIRYWGDLRKMIDRRMIHNGNQASPFSVLETFFIMYSIAVGMMELHKNDIVHRDLKAANVLVMPDAYKAAMKKKVLGDSNEVVHMECDPLKDSGNNFVVNVADFKCTGGVVGTGFWRAPEILIALRNHCFEPNLCTEKSDMYSFGMTCYEIVTGKIPFEGVSPKEYDIVLGGKRLELPSGTPRWIRSMLESCWHHEPSKRLSFEELVEKFVVIDGAWSQVEKNNVGQVDEKKFEDTLREKKL